MPKPTKGKRLGGSAAHQRLILANLVTALFEHGRITTTEAKARFLRPVAEKLITKAKKAELGTVASLHYRREVLKVVRDKSVVHALFTEIGPSFAERPGGYTRITKIGPRKGDNAPMAVIELVTESVEDSRKANAKSSAPTRTATARKAPARTGATTAAASAPAAVAIGAGAALRRGAADAGRLAFLLSSTDSVTSSIIAIGALSPLRGPTLVMRR